MRVAGFCLWGAVLTLTAGTASAAACNLGVMADLPVTMEGMRASVSVKVNGKDTRFWLDSGAFYSIMSKAKAIELGLDTKTLPPGFYVIGTGGNASVDYTTIRSFAIVGHELHNIDFLVGGSDSGNGMIGRNILAIADTDFDLAHGSIKLVQSRGCKHQPLAYWARGQTLFTVPLLVNSGSRDRDFRLPVSINGTKILAVLDSGAPTSLLSRRAAERAGIDLSGPGVTAFSGITGIGRHASKGWVVPVENVSIGQEQILKTHLDVIDGAIVPGPGTPDMLLGADFMLAHHIYVAREQRLIYFTYGGGNPFHTSAPAASSASDSATAGLPPGTHRVRAVESSSPTPESPAAFARRGNAHLARRMVTEAIADLSEAIRQAPATAAYYRDRATAYAMDGRPALALADLDKALALTPGDDALLRARATLRLSQQDEAGALADAEAAASTTPPSSLAAAQLAMLFERLGKPARAIALYDAVIEAHRHDSRLGTLLNGRCWVRGLANIGLDQALDDCNAAIKRDGPKPAFLDSRGLIYFRQGAFADAIVDYDAALKSNPSLPWSLYMRGLARIALGRIDEGKADQKAGQALKADIAEEAHRYGLDTPAS